MSKDELRYDRMVENALRDVVRQALRFVVTRGLPGDHHFYIAFRSADPGVEISPTLRSQYPREMTIVLQHQFWGLEVGDIDFSVTLSFAGKHERLVVPFRSVVSFADPSVNFGLQFEAMGKMDVSGVASGEDGEATAKDTGQAAPLGKFPTTAKQSGLPATVSQDANAVTKRSEKPSGEVVTLDAFRKK